MFRTVVAAASVFVLAATVAGQPLVYDNGPFVTGTGTGFNGADVSVVESGTPTSLGFSEAASPPVRVADNFTLSGGGAGGTRLSAIDFYATQAQSTTITTNVQYTALYIAIYDSNPAAGGTIVAGDFTTNRLQSSTWTGAYRVSSSALTSQTRPITRLRGDMSWAPALADGEHWMVLSARGDPVVYSNPTPQSVIVTPRPPTAVGYQLFNGNWVSTTDYPFRLYGYCAADFNFSGGSPTVQDIFDFLSGYFSSDPAADFNDSGSVTVQDIFDFLAAYFTGCP